MALKFDVDGITQEILTQLKIQLDYAFTAWRTEVLDKLSHPFYGTDMRPEVSYYFEQESRAIIGYLQANTYVLADSYGTGSLMLDNNPGLKKYMANKKGNSGWNPARRGKTIVGRPAGDYTDVFGRKRHSKGSLKGVSLEGRRFRGTKSRKDYYITPTHPSYAVQMAEHWLYQTYLPRVYKYAVDNINFARYLKES